MTDASPPAATPPQQVTATAPALQLIDTLRSRHGPVLFHQSGGCCDGSSPMCFAVGDFIVGDRDVRLGEIGGADFYISAPQFAYWKHTQLIIDVVPGRGGMFSLENGEGVRFLVRSRLFTDEEFAALRVAGRVHHQSVARLTAQALETLRLTGDSPGIGQSRDNVPGKLAWLTHAARWSALMGCPRVTILLATWNRAGMLARTLESIRTQTFPDWELVVADDGSIDDTARVIRQWQQKEARIVYVRNQVNQGTSKNYNSGLRAARGEYVAMIDDDDPWCDREKLAKEVNFLDSHPDHVGCGGGVIVIDSDGREKYRYLKPERDESIRKRMLFSNPMANSTTMFRRMTGEQVGWYDETTRYSGDRDFWMKVGLRGKLYNFPEYFSYYTMSGANTSITDLKPHLRASLLVMKRYRGKYPGYSAALLLNLLQYSYAFLPLGVRSRLHESLAQMKRRVAG